MAHGQVTVYIFNNRVSLGLVVTGKNIVGRLSILGQELGTLLIGPIPGLRLDMLNCIQEATRGYCSILEMQLAVRIRPSLASNMAALWVQGQDQTTPPYKPMSRIM
ncbi:hypothetical protein SLE2022_303690 [Rubroshorea leprosula]